MSRRHARQAHRIKPSPGAPSLTDEDVAWAEERTIALMHAGLPFVEAAVQASHEATDRIMARQLQRELDRVIAIEQERDARRDEARRRRDEEDAVRRAELTLRATQGQRPTLKASLGDLLKTKEKR